MSKSISVLDLKIDLRFSFYNRVAIENRFWNGKYRRNVKSDPDFHVKIDQRF
jgi:hypothetical protein